MMRTLTVAYCSHQKHFNEGTLFLCNSIFYLGYVIFLYTEDCGHFGEGGQHLSAPLEFLEKVTVTKEGTIPDIKTKNYFLKK
jgi:hypothetical protein